MVGLRVKLKTVWSAEENSVAAASGFITTVEVPAVKVPALVKRVPEVPLSVMVEPLAVKVPPVAISILPVVRA